MLSNTVLAALALSVVPLFAQGIPPASFGFPSAPNALNLAFKQPNGTQLQVQTAELFGVNITQYQPTLALSTSNAAMLNYTGPYTIIMVDPDAPTPQNASSRFILHWLQPSTFLSNVTNSTIPGRQLVNTTAPAVPFARPMPPVTSDAHRYILYAFRQRPNFSIPAAYQGYSATNRSGFPFELFVAATNLGTPVAANYFYVSNKTGVPALFVAPPNGMYPGGNGGQVIVAGNGTNGSTTAGGASPGYTSAATKGMEIASMMGLVGVAIAVFA